MTSTAFPFVNGFLLGGSLIIAIGAQNAYVLRQGLIQNHVFVVTSICFLSDAALIVAGVAGLGTLIERNPNWLLIISLLGAAFLIFYGALALRRAISPTALTPQTNDNTSLGNAVVTALALTWGNPHVYLDTVVLIGSLSGRYAYEPRLAFGLGAVAASCVWFYSLGFGARYLAPLFAKPVAWRILDLCITAVMWWIAYTLVLPLL